MCRAWTASSTRSSIASTSIGRHAPSGYLHKLRDITRFSSPGFPILDFTSGDAAVYAEVRARLERAGTPIGALDTLIAAHAVARNLVLVSNNQREFNRVVGLQIQNWAN